MQSTFGRYLILKKIAVGGMAEIFLARRVSIGQFSKFVVLKRLSPEYQGKKSFERLFLNEARLTARLSHSNIVQIHDLGQIEGAYFMAMEYIHGVSSAEMMSKAAQLRRPVPLGVALNIVLSTARALAYCGQVLSHEGETLDILHHDVSPHNIQIRFDGEVKLLDFGVATQIQRQEGSSRRGKFAYMSPEAFHRKPLDQRSDLFSLGVVLYELTMGRRLFKGKTQQETKQRAELCHVPTPRSVHSKFPESLEKLILKALAKDREGRFLEMEEFCKAIEEISFELKLDCSPQRISRYLYDLYGEEIEERSLQLQSLAARADLVGERGLNELATIDSQERTPINLSSEPIKEMINLPHDSSLLSEEGIDEKIQEENNQEVGAEEELEEGGEEEGAKESILFEAEVVEEEVKADIISEPTPVPNPSTHSTDMISATVLPAEFTMVAQRERDWDDERLILQGQRRLRVVLSILVIIFVIGAFLLGQMTQSNTLGSSNLLSFMSETQIQLKIHSKPSGARVIINGTSLGTTPLNRSYTPTTENLTIQIFKSQYIEHRELITTAKGQQVILNVNLDSK